MKKILALLLSVAFIVGLCSCKEEEKPVSRFADGSIEITIENLPKIAVTEHNVNIAVNLVCAVIGVEKDVAVGYVTVCQTADECYKLLADGECELVIAHEPTSVAISYFEQNGIATDSTIIAKDALIFTVNSQNPAENLTVEQITSIYSEQVLNWNEIGFNDGEIKKFKPNSGAASTDAFSKYTGLDASLVNVPKKQIVTDNGSFFAELDYDNGINSITFALYSELQGASVNRFGQTKFLQMSGIKPGATTIQNGEYPLSFDVLLTSKADLEQDSVLKLFKDWILSEQGTAIIRGSGVILPLNK